MKQVLVKMEGCEFTINVEGVDRETIGKNILKHLSDMVLRGDINFSFKMVKEQTQLEFEFEYPVNWEDEYESKKQLEFDFMEQLGSYYDSCRWQDVETETDSWNF